MKRIGVVGLGIMGAGIVEVFARAGYPVVGVAESDEAVAAGVRNLANSLDRAVARGKLTPEQAAEITSRVTTSTDFALFADCDLVVEAAPELIKLKRKIFTDLDSIVGPNAILATNTSSLSVASLAAATNRADRVVGMHFFNPAPVQRFVEVIFTPRTNAQVTQEIAQLAESMGKYVAVVADRPGFIVNRLLLAYLNHAVRILEAGAASRDEIDAAMRELAGFPMGPLELIDLVGIDTVVEILRTIAAATGEPQHVPTATLDAMYAERRLGRKTGSGFYSYAAKHEPPVGKDLPTMQAVHDELMADYLADAQDMLNSGYATKDDINNGMILGCGLPRGPIDG